MAEWGTKQDQNEIRLRTLLKAVISLNYPGLTDSIDYPKLSEEPG